jgi:hypothetical protein
VSVMHSALLDHVQAHRLWSHCCNDLLSICNLVCAVIAAAAACGLAEIGSQVREDGVSWAEPECSCVDEYYSMSSHL